MIKVEMQHPQVLKGLSITIVGVSTYLILSFYYRNDELWKIILFALMSYGLSIYVWILGRKKIVIDAVNNLIMVFYPWAKESIPIQKIVSLDVGWSVEPAPYCTILYSIDHFHKKFRFSLWGFCKENLQEMFTYLHSINKNVMDIDVNKYFFNK